jgi:8-oxo-dGTP pyrophosphatase MutT (NUDIX family)
MPEDESVLEDPNPHGPWQHFELSSGAIVFVERPRTHFLLLMRNDGLLTLPKGHVEHGESAEHAALRELEEETGICSEDVKARGFLGYFTNPIIVNNETRARVLKVVSYHLFELKSERQVRIITDCSHRSYVWLQDSKMQNANFAYSHVKEVLYEASNRIDHDV